MQRAARQAVVDFFSSSCWQLNTSPTCEGPLLPAFPCAIVHTP
jgi:hypothetical protein